MCRARTPRGQRFKGELRMDRIHAQGSTPLFGGQHRAVVSARFAGSFPPILRFEKLERHPVFLRFSNLALTKNLSANLLVKLCGAAFVQIFPPAQRFRVAHQLRPCRTISRLFSQNLSNPDKYL